MTTSPSETTPNIAKTYRVTRATMAHMDQLGEQALAEPVPKWFNQYFKMADGWLQQVRETPLYRATRSGNKLDHGGLVRLHRDIGYAAVYPFSGFLNNMVKVVEANGGEGTPVHTFLTVNRRVERSHGRLWDLQAKGFGISPEEMKDDKRYPISDSALRLHGRLERYSKGRTVLGIACVNFAIETGAALLTSELAPYMLPRMPEDRSGTWLREHADGDEKHSAISRMLLVDMIGDNVELQEEVGRVISATFGDSFELYNDAYPNVAAA